MEGSRPGGEVGGGGGDGGARPQAEYNQDCELKWGISVGVEGTEKFSFWSHMRSYAFHPLP